MDKWTAFVLGAGAIVLLVSGIALSLNGTGQSGSTNTKTSGASVDSFTIDNMTLSSPTKGFFQSILALKLNDTGSNGMIRVLVSLQLQNMSTYRLACNWNMRISAAYPVPAGDPMSGGCGVNYLKSGTPYAAIFDIEFTDGASVTQIQSGTAK